MYVFVSGPYSSNPEKCTEEAIFYGDWIVALGHEVYIPHLAHFWESQIHHEYKYWLEHDLMWVKKCDAVFRIAGESSGADGEINYAKEIGIPVYYDINDIPKK